MERKYLLAAELFAYSFDNYADHLPAGNIRFTTMMPHDAELLEQAEAEGWPDDRVADALDLSVREARICRSRLRRARQVVDASTPAAAFLAGVRFSVEDALNENLDRAALIDRLVEQVCYRAADMGYLLELKGKRLAEYSDELRGRRIEAVSNG